MEVQVQLKPASGSVAASLGYESQVASAVEELGLKLYPRYPGTQDSVQGTLFRVPVSDQETADRAIQVLNDHEGVQSARVG